MHWLNCAAKESAEFAASTITWIHELTHELSTPSCYFDVFDDKSRCFDFPNGVPAAKSAFLEVSSSDKGLAAMAQGLQKLYFGEHSQNPAATLFDELNAYILSTEATAAALKADGRTAVYTAQGYRSSQNLPVLMVNSLIFLSRFKNRNAALYRRVFGTGSKNLAIVQQLLTHAESTYESWEKLVAKTDRPEDPVKIMENEFWKVYQTQKRSVLPP